MLKQVFLAHFEPIQMGFAHGKSQYPLKRDRFGTKLGQKWVKNGSKTRFSKVTLNHWGCTNKCFETIWSLF